MKIKEIIELLQKCENQEKEVYDIITSAYCNSVCIIYDDDTEDEIVKE